MRNTDKQLALSFEEGGDIGSKYISRQQLNTITIKKKDGNLTYKFSDVLNGAYTLKEGGDLTTFANYIPLRSIVKVQLKNGKNVKPINGYWLKKTAKPIRFTKFEEGGDLNNKKYIVSNGKDKGIIVFAENGDEALKKGNRQFYGAYPIKEKLTNVQVYEPNKHQFVSSLGNKKFKYVVHHFIGDGVAGRQTIYDTNIDTKLNERQLEFIGDAKVDYIKFTDSENFEKGGAVKKRSLMSMAKYLVDDYRKEKIKDWYIKNYPKDELGDDINNVNTFEDLWNGINNQKNVYTIIGVGDSLIRERLFQNLSLIYDVDYNYVYKKWLENTDDFARGGAIKQSSKIERKVAEVNSLIREAFDNENDPLYVYDISSSWESPMTYKEVIYRNGRLYIEYYEPFASSYNKTTKEVINKSNMETDGYPTLLNIAKMYRKAIKKFKSGKYDYNGEEYKNGGNLNKSDNDLKLAWLTDLWFAVHQKESKGYNKIGKELDKLKVPYSVQNAVSDNAFENRGRKNPSVSEVKSTIKNILTKKGSFAKGGSLSTKPKFKVGDMVYSYQNKTERRPISYVKESSDSTYDHKYKLSLTNGYSNWIDEKSLSKTTMMKDGGIINKQITFRDWKGDIRVGVISEKLPNGYEVLTDRGVALVKENEIID